MKGTAPDSRFRIRIVERNGAITTSFRINFRLLSHPNRRHHHLLLPHRLRHRLPRCRLSRRSYSGKEVGDARRGRTGLIAGPVLRPPMTESSQLVLFLVTGPVWLHIIVMGSSVRGHLLMEEVEEAKEKEEEEEREAMRKPVPPPRVQLNDVVFG